MSRLVNWQQKDFQHPCHPQQNNATSIPFNHEPQLRLHTHICKHQCRLKHWHTSQLIKTALLDSRATSHFNKLSNGQSITGPSDKAVAVVFSQLINTSTLVLLPMMQLCLEAWHTHTTCFDQPLFIQCWYHCE